MQKEILTPGTARNCASRILAVLLCIAMMVGIAPAISFAAPNETVTISGVKGPSTDYTVDLGTELEAVGLPAELEITVENESSARKANVKWNGDYDKDTVGVYTLTAAFIDTTLHFSPMPTVQITVMEPGASDEKNPLGTNGEKKEPAGSKDVNYSAVCTLTPVETSYASGETIVYILKAQYASPGGDSPHTVKFGIPIPDTKPAVELSMFRSKGSGDYAGVPMYQLKYENTIVNLYLMADSSGKRRIEFTLDAGSSIVGEISLLLPNGISENIDALTLTPEIISQGDYGTNTQLKGGTTKVIAEFGWNDVNKTANIENIGKIGASTKNPDRITYSVTADSQSAGLATGRIFTDHYVLTDTISFSGLHYADGDLTSSETGGITTISVGGKPVLEIAAPSSTLHVTKAASSGRITAFDIQYTVHNTTLGNTNGSAAEIPNLDLSVSLLLSAMQLNSGNEATQVKNNARFEATSVFGDAHVSTASHTAYTQDRYALTKAAFTDETCKQSVSIVEDGDLIFYQITATNNSSGSGPFKITDVLPNGLSYISSNPAPTSQSGQTVTWDGLTIPTGGSMTIVLKTEFDVASFTEQQMLRNVANLYYNGRLYISASADCTFFTGEVFDSNVSYSKTVNQPSAQKGDLLSYTITATNHDSSVPKRITVVDKWPGAGIIPINVAGCGSFKLLDAKGKEYTLADVAANPTLEIAQIKCYNVFIPAGGNAQITIQGRIKKVMDELINTVGDGATNTASVSTYGVHISKTAYAYDAASGLRGDKLSISSPVSTDDIVCYEMQIKNFKDADIDKLQLIDKLPVGLSLESVNFNGVTSYAVLKRGNAYEALDVTSEASTNHQTTKEFKVDAGETVYVYIFAKVSQAAIQESVKNAQRIVNSAYVKFNGVQTGDATANIYTDADTKKKISVDKWFRFVADYDDELHYKGTWLQTPEGDDVQGGGSAPTATVWNGAYIGYQLQIENATAVGNDPIEIYEIIDTLPSGMEFKGVAKNGDRYHFYSATPEIRDLAGELILDGQTADWTCGKHSSRVKCTYDSDKNQVRIQFVDGSNAPAPVSIIPSMNNNAEKLFVLIVARVKDDSVLTSYENIAEVKVKNDIELDDPIKNSLRYFDESYNYVSASCTANTLAMKPGIFKQLSGHYFPSNTNVPPNVETSANIRPGESLRFTVQVKNEGVDDNSNAVNASLVDFTVTDILPAEYTYRPNSATVELNAGYFTTTGEKTSVGASVIARGKFEPTQDPLPDGRTKLTWTFSGKAQRLMCNTKSSQAGFMHIITYDTDWKNTENVLQYGNYENTASVNHSYQFKSVSTGVPDYDKRSIATSAVVSVFGAEGTAAVKKVTNAAGNTVSGTDDTPYVSLAGPGEEVTYTLQVTNSTTTSRDSLTKSLVIIDELPRASSDTGVVNRVDRDSQFSVTFGADPKVVVKKVVGTDTEDVDPTKYNVTYGNSVGALNEEGDWSGSGDGGRVTWVGATESAGKNVIRIAFDPDYSLASDETILVSFSAIASTEAKPGEIAWNSFGYAYELLSGGKYQDTIYAEPPRVGIRTPSATISVDKAVVGDGAPTDALFTFLLKQDGVALAGVKYTLSDDNTEYRTKNDGSFTMTEAQTATLFVTPGSKYTIEEINLPEHFALESINAGDLGDGTYSDSVFKIKSLAAGDEASLICTNNFIIPPKKGPANSLTETIQVEKIIDGDEPNPPKETYKFELTAVSYAAPNGTMTNPMSPAEMPMPAESFNGKATGSITGAGAFAFAPITFATAGTYVYTIVETPGTSKACSYDTSKYTLTYIVTDTEGRLTYTRAIKKEKNDIAADASKIAFTNIYKRPTGQLTVSKVVTNGGVANALFNFSFTFSEKTRYPYVKSDNTSGTIATGESIQLMNGESVTITIHQNVDYMVVENAYASYSPTPVGRTYTGTISATQSEHTLTYTNRYDPQYVPTLTGNLTVQKRVTGDLGDRYKDFAFTIVFNTIGNYFFTGSKTGTIKSGDTILLRHGEYITIVNLPAGTTYSVTESGNTGYRVYTSGDIGTIAANGVSIAAFTNSRSKVPITGDDGSLLMGLILMLISLGGGVILLVALSRHENRHRRSGADK